MPKPFRSTISAKSIDEIRARLGKANHDQPPSAPQDTLNPLLKALVIILASYWVVLLVAMPVVLLLLIFGVGNWTADWLWAAGYGVIGLGLFGVGATCFALVSNWNEPAPLWDRVITFLMLLTALCSLGLAFSLLWQPTSIPLTFADQIRLLATGGFFMAFLFVSEVANLRKYGWRSRPVLIRMLAVIMLSMSLILSFSMLEPENRLPSELRVMQRILQYGGFILLFLTRLPDQQPQPPSRQRTSPTLLIISGLVLAVMLFFILTL